MTARYLATLALFLTACGGDKGSDTGAGDADADADADSDADSDADTDGPTADTAPPEEEFFVVAGIAVQASFGWDNDLQTLIEATTSYGTATPVIAIVLGDDTWVAASGGNDAYCIIFLPLTTVTPTPAWVTADPGITFGFDYDPTVAPVTDCGVAGGYPLDPTLTFPYGGDEATFVGTYASAEWGVGIGQPRTELEVTGMDALIPDMATRFATDVANVFGGTIHNVLLPEEATSTGTYLSGDLYYVALANTITGGAVDEAIFIPATQIAVPAGGIATGFYQIRTNIYWPLLPPS